MTRRQQVLNQTRETKSQEDRLEVIYIRSPTQNCENYNLRCPGTKTPNNWGAQSKQKKQNTKKAKHFGVKMQFAGLWENP